MPALKEIPNSEAQQSFRSNTPFLLEGPERITHPMGGFERTLFVLGWTKLGSQALEHGNQVSQIFEQGEIAVRAGDLDTAATLAASTVVKVDQTARLWEDYRKFLQEFVPSILHQFKEFGIADPPPEWFAQVFGFTTLREPFTAGGKSEFSEGGVGAGGNDLFSYDDTGPDLSDLPPSTWLGLKPVTPFAEEHLEPNLQQVPPADKGNDSDTLSAHAGSLASLGVGVAPVPPQQPLYSEAETQDVIPSLKQLLELTDIQAKAQSMRFRSEGVSMRDAIEAAYPGEIERYTWPIVRQRVTANITEARERLEKVEQYVTQGDQMRLGELTDKQLLRMEDLPESLRTSILVLDRNPEYKGLTIREAFNFNRERRGHKKTVAPDTGGELPGESKVPSPETKAVPSSHELTLGQQYVVLSMSLSDPTRRSQLQREGNVAHYEQEVSQTGDQLGEEGVAAANKTALAEMRTLVAAAGLLAEGTEEQRERRRKFIAAQPEGPASWAAAEIILSLFSEKKNALGIALSPAPEVPAESPVI